MPRPKPASARHPVSPDGKVLFFTQSTPGTDEDVYWVSARIIDKLKAETNRGQAPAERNEMDYLGQTPPGDLPVRFAPDLVSTGHHEHSRIVFSPDGLELYWAVIPVDPDFEPGSDRPFLSDQQNIWFTDRNSTGWSKPRVLPTTENRSASSPALSASGSTLYFKSVDPQADPEERPRPSVLYRVTKKSGVWSDPVVVSNILPEKTGMVSSSVCFAHNGNLYFDHGGPDPTGTWQWGVYVSEYRNGKYDEPQSLPNGINDGEMNVVPVVLFATLGSILGAISGPCAPRRGRARAPRRRGRPGPPRR